MIQFTTPQLFVIVGLAFVLLELFVGIDAGLDLVLLGSILISSGFAGNFLDSYVVTLLLSSILSVLYIAFGRNRIKQKIIVMTKKTNIDRLGGGKGVVVRSITPDTPGLVRLDDEDWRASSDEVIYEKEKVQVLGVEGVTLKVQKTLEK